jgi:transposase
MSRFPSANHVASWAGVCPGNNQRGGNRLSAGTTGGKRWVRAILGEVVWVMSRSRTKGTYVAAPFQRLMRRRGKYKAVSAVAHTLLVIIYHLLREHVPSTDLGPDSFDQLDKARVERHHVRRLEQLGYAVTLAPAVA